MSDSISRASLIAILNARIVEALLAAATATRSRKTKATARADALIEFKFWVESNDQ